MTDLLKKLMLASGVPGREDKIRELIIKEAEPYADEIKVDPVGNLIVRKKGEGKKIMLCAHMDEIGFFVSYIGEDGLIKVHANGAIVPLASAYTSVISERGVHGVLVADGTKDVPKVENMSIDIGATSKKQAEKQVKVGDFFVCEPHMRKLMGTRYVGRPFDDRVGCAILLQALKEVKEAKNDLYFVFSTQEEVGARGARAVAFSVAPDIGIAFDVTYAGEKPGSPTMDVKLGKGCAIKIKDSGVICSPYLVNRMRELAEENGIKYQNEVLLSGGTDASELLVAGHGAMAGAISIPCGYIHTLSEMIDMFDVKEAVKLTVAICEKM